MQEVAAKKDLKGSESIMDSLESRYMSPSVMGGLDAQRNFALQKQQLLQQRKLALLKQQQKIRQQLLQNSRPAAAAPALSSNSVKPYDYSTSNLNSGVTAPGDKSELDFDPADYYDEYDANRLTLIFPSIFAVIFAQMALENAARFCCQNKCKQQTTCSIPFLSEIEH